MERPQKILGCLRKSDLLVCELFLSRGGGRFSSDYLIGKQGAANDVGFHAGADQFGFPGGALNVALGNAELNSQQHRAFEKQLEGFLG